MRASAVQITFISLFTVLLTLDAAPGRNQLERKPAGTNVTLEDPQHRATASDSSAVAKREAAALHKESLTPPVGLKPAEQEAWLAMARRRQDASDGIGHRSWIITGSLHYAHFFHTATLLQTGKVLVAGGEGLTNAELYDPATGTWTDTGSMSTVRYLHTATLLPNGKALVAGGQNGSDLSSAARSYMIR